MSDGLTTAAAGVWVGGPNGGALVDPASATVSAFDHGLTVGDGVFETCKVVRGQAFAMTRHLRRLERSAAGLGLPMPDEELVRQASAAVLETVDPVLTYRLRITWTGGISPLGSERGTAGATLVVAAAAAGVWPETATVAVVPWRRNEHSAVAGLKTTSYAENVVALAWAHDHGGDEAVFGNTAGRLCEGTGTNVILGLGGRLVTPPLSSGCLAGVTRALAIEWCGVTEEDLPLEAIYEADEVLLASSTRDLQPVREVDGKPVGSGRVGPLAAAAVATFRERAAEQVDP